MYKKLFVNREVSWLGFNGRVLQEAADHDVPLLERLRFLGIFSNNLDEFFRVRVATNRRLLHLKKSSLSVDQKKDIKKLLEKVQEIVLDQQTEFNRIYLKELLPALRQEGIFIVNEKELNEHQARAVRTYFQETVVNRLFPILLDPGKPLPVLKDGSIYLAVRLRNSTTRAFRYALVALPTSILSRFFIIPGEQGRHTIILLDDVIRASLDLLFSSLDYNEFTAHTIKITRDAEMDLDTDISASVLEKVKKSLHQRKLGAPVRFIYDAEIPADMLSFLASRLKIDAQGIIPGQRYHNFRDFMKFPKVGSAELLYAPMEPLHIPELDAATSVFDVMDRKDILLHHPYHGFGYVIRLLREAAIDPWVKHIHISLYRIAENSSIANALINAVKNGKKVTVVMELRARFDEEHNIFWANKLKEEGAEVIYGVSGYKVHSKCCLISRSKGGKNKLYAHVSTGNYNDDTSRVYSDIGLLTSQKRITADCQKLFRLIRNFPLEVNRIKLSHCLISPVNMRSRILDLIHQEKELAKTGKTGRIIMKMNSLVDETMIRALADAAVAGVHIDLIIRGSCSLKASVKELDGRIRAISIVDRFLEHSRIYWFGNSGKPLIYMGSADLMTRNIDLRVELTVPILDTTIARTITDLLELQMDDNTKARMQDGKISNRYIHNSAPLLRSQMATYELLARQQTGANAED
ncbi:MAG: polyphosphate kinase 1 [Bacteroidota bacterium]